MSDFVGFAGRWPAIIVEAFQFRYVLVFLLENLVMILDEA